jgi:hypothetical protein
MDVQLRERAEARLTAAAAELNLADPRPPYRERLRRLRETDPAAFERAVAHYEQTVLPALTTAEPLTTWLEYGKFLTGGAVRTTVIDAAGRAGPVAAPVPSGSLVLLIPDEPSADVLIGAAPLQPSPAQQATLDLLVSRSLALSDR